MEAHRLLVDLGLTSAEARVYLILLEEPGARVPQLAQAARISRPRAYDLTASLVKRGLASERPGMYKRFDALPLTAALRRLVELERARLDALQARVASLDEAPAEPAPPEDVGGTAA